MSFLLLDIDEQLTQQEYALPESETTERVTIFAVPHQPESSATLGNYVYCRNMQTQ